MSCPNFTHLLVLPHIRVQNANAISSPLTHGFPSITAFLGLMWALERKTHAAGLDLEFGAIGVVCHGHEEQTGGNGAVKLLRLTRNPGDEKGKPAPIIEEGRIHLDISLVLALNAEGWYEDAQQRDVQAIAEILQGMRVAGGTVLPPVSLPGARDRPWAENFTGNSDDRAHRFRRLRSRLLPGSALVARDDIINRRLIELQATAPNATRIDAWLSVSRTNCRYEPGANGGTGAWRGARESGPGWIVPIPVGYAAISQLHDAGVVTNARDATTPFRFVESIYSAGEWVGPHRMRSPQDLLWYADSRPDEGMYRCRNDYHAIDPTSD